MAKKATGLSELISKYSTNKEEQIVPTKVVMLDSIIGGGLARGYTYGFWGTPGAGKTTICLQIIKNLCKLGERCAIIDVEKSISEFQQETFGIREYVENGQLIITTCMFMNEYEELALGLIESGEISYLLVDSVGFIQPFVSKGLTVEDVRPGIKSLQIAQVGPKIKAAAYNNKVTVLNIYQARANLDMGGNMYAPKEKVAAGFSEQHLVDCMIKLSTSAKIEDEDKNQIGNLVWITTDKNKFAPPHRRVQSTLIFGKGFSRRYDTINMAIERGIIEQGGAVFTVHLPDGDVKIKGRKALYDMDNSMVKSISNILN